MVETTSMVFMPVWRACCFSAFFRFETNCRFITFFWYALESFCPAWGFTWYDVLMKSTSMLKDKKDYVYAALCFLPSLGDVAGLSLLPVPVMVLFDGLRFLARYDILTVYDFGFNLVELTDLAVLVLKLEGLQLAGLSLLPLNGESSQVTPTLILPLKSGLTYLLSYMTHIQLDINHLKRNDDHMGCYLRRMMLLEFVWSPLLEVFA
ncbi:hypothetical protein Nepgr_027869 [Nepenthes gracilis]|uniref:Uncharacterized protein n=1 Tax=Nepenthes gracilis TaxID=150966 RepID=A0AAD3Y401_NEPGR|nr:hypothetical protein Nepgr_027869 [Nepenthes gracilis]